MEVKVVDNSPNPKETGSKSSLLPKIIVAFVAAILILNVAVFSFLIGRSTSYSVSNQEESIQVNTREALGAEDVNQEVTDTASPSADGSNSLLSPTPTSAAKEIVITSAPKTDGFRASDGTGSSVSAIQVGRNQDVVSRGFLSFDLQEIPSGAEVTEAIIEVYIVSTEGNPNRLGGLFLDHLVYGDTLDASDYSSVAILSSFTEFERTRREGQWISADVSTVVINDLDSTRTNSQFRLHFENETKTSSEDFIILESGENYMNSGNIARLRIKYQ